MARHAESGFNYCMETPLPSRPPALWLRLVRTLGSYLLACVAAGAILLIAFLAVATAEEGDILSLSADDVGGGLIFIIFASVYISIIAALPALGAVFLVRALRWPRGWSDALAGAFIGFAAGHLMLFGFSPAPPHPVSLAFLVAGLPGGFVYWRANARPRPPYGTTA